jgi:hypothetical protein
VIAINRTRFFFSLKLSGATAGMSRNYIQVIGVLYRPLRQAGVPAGYHIYAEGEHAFGIINLKAQIIMALMSLLL